MDPEAKRLIPEGKEECSMRDEGRCRQGFLLSILSKGGENGFY